MAPDRWEKGRDAAEATHYLQNLERKQTENTYIVLTLLQDWREQGDNGSPAYADRCVLCRMGSCYLDGPPSVPTST